MKPLMYIMVFLTGSLFGFISALFIVYKRIRELELKVSMKDRIIKAVFQER